MNGYLLLPQKIVQCRVGIKISETVEFIHIFCREITWLLFVALLIERGKFKGIVAALQPSVIEEIIGFFHRSNFSCITKIEIRTIFTFGLVNNRRTDF